MKATKLKHISVDLRLIGAITFALSVSACGSGFHARTPNSFAKQQNDPGLMEQFFDLTDVSAGNPQASTSGDQNSSDDSDQENTPDDPAATGVAGASETQPNNFKFMDLNSDAQKRILEHYKYVDPKHEIDKSLLSKALSFYFVNQNNLANNKILTVIDYSRPSSEKRLFVINMDNGQMWSTYVAHGSGSDKDRDGIAEGFSNKVNSNATSIGPFLTMSPYSGKHGNSLRLKGLAETNSNAFRRNIVVHGADYVHDEPILQGRSWGCVAVNPKYTNKFVSLIKGGSLIFSGLSNPSIAHEF